MAQKPFHTEITADESNYLAALEHTAQVTMTDAQRMQSTWRAMFYQIGQDASDSVKKMNSAFDTGKEALEKFRGLWVGLLGAVGANSVLGRMAGDSAKAAIETDHLAENLGTTTENATALKLALSDIGAEEETYTGLLSKITVKLRENEQGLKSNEDRFKALGIATRDQNGNLLSGEQVMKNALAAMLEFKSGTDRNLASSEVFGKGWADVVKILRLTPEVMDGAKKSADELQLTVGPQGVARARAYQTAMSGMDDTFKAIANRIGQALMPVLTGFAQWMQSVGPTAVNVMRGYMLVLGLAFYSLENGVVVIVRTISAALFTLIEPLAAISEALYLALNKRFAEAGDRLKAVPKNIGNALSKEYDAMVENGEEWQRRMKALLDFNVEQGTTPQNKDDGTKQWKPARQGNRMAEFEEQLAAQRQFFERSEAEAGGFREFSKRQEAAYWQDVLARDDLTKDERIAVLRKYYAAYHDLRKSDFDAEIGDIRARMETFKQGSQQRVDLAQQIATRIGAAYGTESKEYKAATAEVNRLTLERAQYVKQLTALALDAERSYSDSVIAIEREKLDQLEQLGLITNREKLEGLKSLRASELALEIQSEEDKAELYKNDELQYQQHLNRLAALKQKAAIDQMKIDGQIAMESKKTLDKLLDPIGDAVQGMVNGVLQGTQTIQQMVRNSLIGIASQYGATLVKMGLEWVKHEILKTQATAAGAATRTSVEAGAAATSTGITAGTTIKSIGMKAWDAAAGVYASVAAIPIIGPFLAPAMALAAAATVAGFIGKIATAAGGFDVPAGVNPMTQLHSEEMVLPKDIANPLRENLKSGGGVRDIHFHGVIDARSWWKKNRGEIVRVLREADRDFVRP